MILANGVFSAIDLYALRSSIDIQSHFDPFIIITVIIIVLDGKCHSISCSTFFLNSLFYNSSHTSCIWRVALLEATDLKPNVTFFLHFPGVFGVGSM